LVYKNIASHYPAEESRLGVKAIALNEEINGYYSGVIGLIAAAAICLFAISIVNLAGLIGVRSGEQRREMAIRLALGSNRIRLVRKILSETFTLGLWGGILGIVVARGTIQLIQLWAPTSWYRISDIELDGYALGWIFLLLLLATLGAGLLPAMRLIRTDPGIVLKQEGSYSGTSSPQRQRAQSFLVIGQFGLVTLLLISAGLLIRSFQRIQEMPLGFEPRQVLTALLYPTNVSKYRDNGSFRRFFHRVEERLRQMPDVISTASNDELPFIGVFATPFEVLGRTPEEPGREPIMLAQAISRDYFHTVQIPLLQGRAFTKEDREGSQKVCIVDKAFADRFFPEKSALGQQIIDSSFFSGRQISTIVGVVANSQGEKVDTTAHPAFQIYFPYDQRNSYQQYLLLRTRGNPTSLVPELQRAISEIDPEIPLTEVAPYTQVIEENYTSRKLAIDLVSIYSIAALLLSMAGIYSLQAYYVVQRRRDVGIRIMLGSNRGLILKYIFSYGMRLAGIGVLIGVVSAVLVFFILRSFLYHIAPLDPIAILVSVVVVEITAAMACLIPSLRALQIDPMKVLRE
jgi:predicted permease